MQIRKTYQGINPELLYAEIKEFSVKQGVTLADSKMETYGLPGDSSSFISRGTMTFKSHDKECLRVHVVGSVNTETKVLIDIDDSLFPKEKISALQGDLDFIFAPYEAKD